LKRLFLFVKIQGEKSHRPRQARPDIREGVASPHCLLVDSTCLEAINTAFFAVEYVQTEEKELTFSVCERLGSNWFI